MCGAEGDSEEVFFGVDGGVSTRKTTSKKRKIISISKADSVVDAAGASICGPPGGSDVSTVSAMEAAESLIELSLGEGSTDNISAIVVKFPKLIRSKL